MQSVLLTLWNRHNMDYSHRHIFGIKEGDECPQWLLDVEAKLDQEIAKRRQNERQKQVTTWDAELDWYAEKIAEKESQIDNWRNDHHKNVSNYLATVRDIKAFSEDDEPATKYILRILDDLNRQKTRLALYVNICKSGLRSLKKGAASHSRRMEMSGYEKLDLTADQKDRYEKISARYTALSQMKWKDAGCAADGADFVNAIVFRRDK